MRRLLFSLTTLSMIGVLSLGFSGCTEDDDNPITPVDEVVAPTQLRAYSDDGIIGLDWNPSASETQSNFKGYYIKLVEVGTTDTTNLRADAGNGAYIDELTNGIRYYIRVYAEDTDNNLSANYSEITWAPATRQYQDNQGNEIQVYATTSATKPSGIDIYNASGKAEVISQAGTAFAQRGDLYVYAETGTSQALEIRSAQNAQNNPGPITYFNTKSPEDADNLSGIVQTSPPNDANYTLQSISIGDGPATIGKMYWGKLVRGSDEFYFRMLVRSVNGKLVQGSGAERYLVLEFSYQSMPNVQYAKRVK